MEITFKKPEDESKHKTHICVWVSEGALQGFEYITVEKAKTILNRLQNLIWQAEAKPVEE